MSKKLSEQDEKLLTSFHDGECGLVKSYFASRLLKRSEAAQKFVRDLRQVSSVISSVMRSSYGNSALNPSGTVDLWDRISARIDAEERAELLLGKRNLSRKGARASIVSRLFEGLDEWRTRLAWGGGGAALAAVFSAVVISTGVVGGGAGQISGSGIANSNFGGNSRIPIAAPVSYSSSGSSVNRSNSGPIEMDWMRSEGRLRVLQDPSDRSAIIWVKPRNGSQNIGIPTDYSSYSSRQSRRMSRANSRIPVAVPAVGR